MDKKETLYQPSEMPPQDDALAFASPCFLGSNGENSEIFEHLLLDFFRDHVYWRRNFHPEDPLTVPVLAAQHPSYIDFMGRTRTELHALAASLKRSVPFFNPRYVGHMVSDSLMPGLLAQLITTFYNPNNLSAEAAPVTLDMELKVGEQLAAMLGYATKSDTTPRAWGHLTSGGTLANFENLVNLRRVRCFPLALKDAAAEQGVKLALEMGDAAPLESLDDWALFNLPLDVVMSLPAQLANTLRKEFTPEQTRNFKQSLARARIEALGAVAFAARHPLCATTAVMVPMTAHYSWRKAAKVLGFGSNQLVAVPVDNHMRLSVPALERILHNALASQTPILGVVAVLGTTEFGTIDPLHEIVALRERFRSKGLEFAVHVDAAWGGYLTSIFREPDGALASHATIRNEFKYFPSSAVYEGFAALPRADSVTVDPHKLGYLPYGIGGIVWRDRRVTQFLEEKAAYLFLDEQGDADDDERIKQHFGQFILEGSKPGAAAAAAWVAHRVLPLDRAHFGRLQRQTIRTTEYFFDRLQALQQSLTDVARLAVPFEPDTNLLCLAVNPAGNRSLVRMNRFGRHLYGHLSVNPDQPVQLREFFSSHTAVKRGMIDAGNLAHVLESLGVDANTFVEDVLDPEREADSLFLLRHTLMNPWQLQRSDGRNYIDRYCEYLERIIRTEIVASTSK
jgi:glutamate/tyrosine decarboxylase-like PLP-dependent enzyme